MARPILGIPPFRGKAARWLVDYLERAVPDSKKRALRVARDAEIARRIRPLPRKGRKDAAVQGTASFMGTVACLTIAVELYEDLTEGKAHFRLPRPAKLAALWGFAFWAVLEAQKVRRRINYLLRNPLSL